jgi:hypothetical protein
VSNLQPLVTGPVNVVISDVRESHRTCSRRGREKNCADIQLLMLTRLLSQPNCHGALARSSAHNIMIRAPIQCMYMRRENVF